MTRRDLLHTMGAGFGMVGLRGLAGAETVDPLAAESAPLPRQGQARHLPLPERRSVAGRHIRPQTQADKYHGKPIPSGNLRTERKTGNLLKSPFTFKQIRAKRHRSQRNLSQTRRMRRRPVRHPVDVHRPAQSRAVAVHDELRREAAGAALDGLLGDLRSGHGEPESAGLCGAMSRTAGGGPPTLESTFLPAVYQGTYIDTEEKGSDRLIQNIRNKS